MQGKSVLIADDNLDMLELWRLVFEVEGFNVLTAEDGRLALEMLDARLPDVVVTDLMMPQVNGLELIRRMRASPRWRTIPVIAVSAYPEDHLREAQKVGATCVVCKPVEFSELIEMVKGCLAAIDARGYVPAEHETR